MTCSLILRRKSQRYEQLGTVMVPCLQVQHLLKNFNDNAYRLGVSSQSMNEIYFRSRTKMSSGLDVPLGVSFPPSSKRRNPRVRISTSEQSAIIVKRSRPNSNAYARMYLMFWTSHLSQRPSQANQKSFTIRCTSFILNFEKKEKNLGAFRLLTISVGKVIITAISQNLHRARSAKLPPLLPTRRIR